MLKNIYLPRNLGDKLITIDQVYVAAGDRIRRDQPLLYFKTDDGDAIKFPSPSNGWVRFVAVQSLQEVEPGTLLLVIDAQGTDDYRLDEEEVNPHTELGEKGRRGEERQGQKQYAEAYSGELFDAPEQGTGQQRSVREHPLLQNMKEGVPPKMSNAHNNGPATDRLAENASQDPELQQQLSQSLQAQLDIAPASTTAPSLSRG